MTQAIKATPMRLKLPLAVSQVNKSTGKQLKIGGWASRCEWGRSGKWQVTKVATFYIEGRSCQVTGKGLYIEFCSLMLTSHLARFRDFKYLGETQVQAV